MHLASQTRAHHVAIQRRIRPPMTTPLFLRAGLVLGAVRTAWIVSEHLIGARSTHLEWVEPSYGIWLLVGAPATWIFLLRAYTKSCTTAPPTLKSLAATGLGAGLISGLIHAGVFWVDTTFVSPQYLDAFIAWNVENSTNTLDVANREFRLPAFLDILLVHPLATCPITAVAVSLVLPKTR